MDAKTRTDPAPRRCCRSAPVVLGVAAVAISASALIVLPGCGGSEPNPRVSPSEQVRTLEERHDHRVVHVQATCCGAGAADLDALIAFGVQAAMNLPNDAPFIVRGDRPVQVAAVAERLSQLGATQVVIESR